MEKKSESQPSQGEPPMKIEDLMKEKVLVNSCCYFHFCQKWEIIKEKIDKAGM